MRKSNNESVQLTVQFKLINVIKECFRFGATYPQRFCSSASLVAQEFDSAEEDVRAAFSRHLFDWLEVHCPGKENCIKKIACNEEIPFLYISWHRSGFREHLLNCFNFLLSSLFLFCWQLGSLFWNVSFRDENFIRSPKQIVDGVFRDIFAGSESRAHHIRRVDSRSKRYFHVKIVTCSPIDILMKENNYYSLKSRIATVNLHFYSCHSPPIEWFERFWRSRGAAR